MHGLQVRQMQILQGGINDFIPWAGSGLVAEPEYFFTGAVYVPCTPCVSRHVMNSLLIAERVYSQFAPLLIRPSSQLSPLKYWTSWYPVLPAKLLVAIY